VPRRLEVHGEGYCYNSENKNKRPYPRVCASKPLPTLHTLVYNYGTLDAWFGHLAAHKCVLPPLLLARLTIMTTMLMHMLMMIVVSIRPGSVAWITSCDRRITHGVYDMGSSPSVTLFNSGTAHTRLDTERLW
jgi:hypothetical protein